jgi:hypothetical protein
MKYIRIYTGDDELTHFEDVEVPGEPSGASRASELIPAQGVIFRYSPGGEFHDWHPAPRSCREDQQYGAHLTR